MNTSNNSTCGAPPVDIDLIMPAIEQTKDIIKDNEDIARKIVRQYLQKQDQSLVFDDYHVAVFNQYDADLLGLVNTGYSFIKISSLVPEGKIVVFKPRDVFKLA